MSRRRKQGGKSLDVIQRLQQRVAEGDYYEALQLYKTSYSRLKAQEKLDEAEELLTTGAVAMCVENEVSGSWEQSLDLGAASHYKYCTRTATTTAVRCDFPGTQEAPWRFFFVKTPKILLRIQYMYGTCTRYKKL